MEKEREGERDVERGRREKKIGCLLVSQQCA